MRMTHSCTSLVTTLSHPALKLLLPSYRPALMTSGGGCQTTTSNLINDSKTEFLFIRSKFGKHPTNPTITIGQDKITPAPTARNLGVVFDEHLTLKPHVASLCKSAFFQIHQIGQIRKFLMTATAKTVVHSIVTSRLDYCNGALAGLPDCEFCHSVACLTTLTKNHDHITPVLVRLHWLPVCQCILFKVLVITYKAINGLASSYISDLISIHMPSRSLHSSTRLQLSVPHYKTTSYGFRAFSRFAPVEFNNLPPPRYCPGPHTLHFQITSEDSSLCFCFWECERSLEKCTVFPLLYPVCLSCSYFVQHLRGRTDRGEHYIKCTLLFS